MLRRLLTLTACLLPCCRHAPTSDDTTMHMAEQARWKHRLIVLSAPTNDDADLREQHDRLMSMADELIERHLLVIRLTPSTAAFGDMPIDAADVHALRTRWSIGDDRFHAALIGKDGRVKDRWSQPFDPNDMTALIDTMPMRQDEMQSDRP